jgi:hypothetical protein
MARHLGDSVLPALRLLQLGLACLWFTAVPVPAQEVSWPFEYRVMDDGTVEITFLNSQYDEESLEVPSHIDARPVTRIGFNAFHQVTKLLEVTLPDTVVSIGAEAFYGCGNLTRVTLGKGLVTIEARAFSGCFDLEALDLPASLTSLDPSAFESCGSLQSLGVDAANPVYASVQGVLFNKSRNTLVRYPPGRESGYTIPVGVTSIGPWAFSECRLIQLVMPEGVVAIGGQAFTYCWGLSSVALPSSLVELGDQAFYGCGNLPSIHLPPGMKVIGKAPFGFCIRLESITVDPGNSAYSSDAGVLFNKTRTALVQYPAGRSGSYAVPGGVTVVGHGAFEGCANLSVLQCPDGLVSIGPSAFEGCRSLLSVFLPESVTSIGIRAFADCNELAAVSLPPMLSTVPEQLFWGCGRLRSVTLPSGLTEIHHGAFASCTALTGIRLPAGLISIGSYAFGFCSSLTVVTLGTAIDIIGPLAFSDCAALTQVAFLGNAPANVGDFAFSNATVVYFRGGTGFTSPTWRGYPSVMIDEAEQPAVVWLMENGYPYFTPLDQDPDGDGVSLLLAYALDLDPHRNPAASLPDPVLGADGLQIDFHATSPGITYRVETSDDLARWTTEGVVVSPPGADQRSTAVVPRDGASRFLRLVVEQE